MAKTANDLVTKKYLDSRFYKFKKEFRKEINEDMRDLKEEFKNEVVSFKDEVITEIKKLREDDEVHKFSHARINEELQEHTKSIAKLQSH